MSQNYAAGLSDYAHKGVLGLPEVYDSELVLQNKILELADLVRNAKHAVIHTGAGISTAAGSIWTAEKTKVAPAPSKPFHEAIPTYTHMAIKELVTHDLIKFVVSQNIDGLHMRSGLSPNRFTELHGNVYMEECRRCHCLFVRNSAAPTIGRKATGGVCQTAKQQGRPCRGMLTDTVLDWCSVLPEPDLAISTTHSTAADLNIVLGSTMQINPSGELPMTGKTRDAASKFVICNLQKTKFDGNADLVIRAKVDDIFRGVMQHLGISVATYQAESDPILGKHQERTVLVRCLHQPPAELLPQPKGNKRKKGPQSGLKKSESKICKAEGARDAASTVRVSDTEIKIQFKAESDVGL